ncbi:hypothetical protein RJ639_021943 [Escallonia herrerae]|uniref:Glycosyltransferase n=1 Tax=Escallonia herrerae TaxID=1293975 RepID=A0AA88V4Z6_9ASTE|nr:hypothetical protein RJ639_021943 [Escallonia herrerae]
MDKHGSSEPHSEELEILGRQLLHEVDVYMKTHKTRTDGELIERVFSFLKVGSTLGGEVHVTHRVGDPYNTWDVEKLACNVGLHLKEKVEFRQSEDSGYHNKRGSGINAFVAAITYSSKGSSLFSLPSSSWAWTTSIGTSSSSFSISSFGINTSSPWRNPRTALYPTFASEKMNRAVSNLVKDLNTESVLRRGKERDEKLERTEAGLARARALIRDATIDQSSSSSRQDPDYIPRGDIYRNAFVFHRSYVLMEHLFKIFVYEEGDLPLFHNGPCKDIYSTEGIFLSLMETATHFRTRDPEEAHVYFLPFSVVMILEHLFDPIIRDKAVLGRVIGDYVHTISTKYPYWNRSLGADHFMLSCHDWGPRATWYVHELYFTSIRALCNANISEFFNPRKDASIPDINLRTGDTTGLIGGMPLSNRTVLAFFAGQLHGRIRPALFQHWKDKDEDIRVYEKVPEGVSYEEMMKKSKYCICPSGYEVATPRIVEAIYAECVPVLISQHYVIPFSDVLNWDAFSIQVSLSEIPNLKEILMGTPEDKYVRMHEGVKQVQRHFLVNDPPKRYDVFHMILHSIWLRRLNLQIYG